MFDPQARDRERGRYTWLFPVNAAEVLDGCNERHTYHLTCLDYWTKERDDVKAKIAEVGIEIEDVGVTGGYRSNIQIRPDLEQRWHEVKSKIAEHTRKCEEYGAFETALSLMQGTAVLSLTIDDIRFFNIGETADSDG